MCNLDKTEVKQAEKRQLGDESRIPGLLLRTRVYKRVPEAERSRLDADIMFHPEGYATLKSIANKYKLVDRYGISRKALDTYAQRLAGIVRPAMSSLVLANLLGCLPESYRRSVVDGGHVMLLSRVMQVLSCGGCTPLSVAELARLASLFSAIAARNNVDRGTGKAGGGKDKDVIAEADSSGGDPVKIAESVRMLYGLPWPLKEADSK
ncbi:MAG: hypothetical protein ACYTF1_06030 [Planctomycetota bacterium]|jgi:hypothetical protein